MAAPSIQPKLLVADAQGNIYEEPELLMICRRGRELGLPRPDELTLLPEDGQLFFLPGRRAVGLEQESGELEELDDLAVSAFALPGYIATSHPAFQAAENAPELPDLSYGAAGFANGRIYVCAKKIDDDLRENFNAVSAKKLRKSALDLSERFAKNRLIQYVIHKSALEDSLPAAKNFCLGRYEVAVPISAEATAPGCKTPMGSKAAKNSGPAQNVFNFTPTAAEVLELLRCHEERAEQAIYSFGEGYAGEPLEESALLLEVIREFRASGGKGTINLCSNGCKPEQVGALGEAGLSSLVVPLNSVRPQSYVSCHNPSGYNFDDVKNSLGSAKKSGVHVALRLLYFPGFSDTELEAQALVELVQEFRVDMLQLHNLSIDPDSYMELMQDIDTGPVLGFTNFKKRVTRSCPGLKVAYFNPYLG